MHGHGQGIFLSTGHKVSKSQYDKVMNYINIAKSEGATVVTGGGRPEHLTSGYFIAPTVLSGMKPHMTVWREEVFGPVSRATTC
jgi:acyl-CoA reductase-like NAD-dependent aldehyde dehydrogenase